MNAFLKIILLSTFSFIIQAQSLQVEKEYNSNYYEINDLEVNLTADKITISSGAQDIYIENLPGKKIFKTSPAENYFFIASHLFSNDKADYPIEIRVFDRNGNLAFPFRFTAPYDLPHQLFNINDFGMLTSFDPVTLKVTVVGDEIFREVELEKDIPFEMEKAAFTEITEDFLFVLTSQKALDITEEANNAVLYRINLNDLSIYKKELDYNTPTLLKMIGGNLIVSGVKFENLKPVGKTIKFNLELNQLASNDKIIEKIVNLEDKIFAKYFNTVYQLEKDLSIANHHIMSDDERISDIGITNDRVIVFTHVSDKTSLYFLFLDLSMDFKYSLDIFEISKTENFSIRQNHVLIRHDSRSVKLKTNRN